MSKNDNQTPLMQQYWSVKDEHPDKIILFRMGDFFEMFHDDAVTAAPILNIALTRRNKKDENSSYMCGVPHHSIAGPISKLLDAGHYVAICDQLEDPKEAKGIVKRGVTRILSPGMVYDPETLDQESANYLCSFDERHIAFLDSSTGECFFFEMDHPAQCFQIIDLIQPKEIICDDQRRESLKRHFGSDFFYSKPVSKSLNLPVHFKDFPAVVGELLQYACFMQGEDLLRSISLPEKRELQERLKVSQTVLRHLEVFSTYKGEKQGSLFKAINRCRTSGGARLLKNWMAFPLANKEEIEKRLNRVEYWFRDPALLKRFRVQLGSLGDIERRLGKLALPTCSPRDLVALAESLFAGIEATALYFSHLNSKNESDLLLPPSLRVLCNEILEGIQNTLADEPPANLKNGGAIRSGVSHQLDEYIKWSENSQQLLVEMEAKEREEQGIPSLKIKYNNVFGYFIEVTNAHKDKVPDHYKRKQTLTNAERYLTQELQELEDKVLSAKSKRVLLEQEIFLELKEYILKSNVKLLQVAKIWSEWDIYSSLAWLAIEYNYVRPQFSEAFELDIKSSRHPVVEQEMKLPFTPNDIHLNYGECLLLTGPNMAGKSTLMRQVALVSMMAQCGSFIPAASGKLPLFTQIYTRIGASDFLNEGLSTFMVEMKETAEMLERANSSTLVLLDEIGRGTSTYDGMSLAQSILEYLVIKKQCITLFATHYHELTSLGSRFPQIKNAHMSAKESGGDISFLHTLVPGPANKSYGIQVARLAGLPPAVTKRAKGLLSQLENFGLQKGSEKGDQLSLIESSLETIHFEDEPMVKDPINQKVEQLLDEIKGTSVQSLTPLDALNRIAQWQQNLS